MGRLFASFVLLFLFLVGCNNNLNNRMVREAQEYTQKHCPQRLDDFTALDSMVYDVSTRIYWRCFSIDTSAASVVLSRKDVLKQYLVNELKGDAKWKTCKDEAINFGYVYKAIDNGQTVCTIILEPKDYQ